YAVEKLAKVEDISHGSHDVSFMLRYYFLSKTLYKDRVFTLGHLKRVVTTFSQNVFTGRYSKPGSIFATRVDGVGVHKDVSDHHAGRWVGLTNFDSEVWEIVFKSFKVNGYIDTE